ncbi:hypothetical protein ACLI1A_01735 [Flavobacterium sp. RHBU_3]|uniref:hypothetical protein n=1 Tax=Flavobacterium sp. RHBU_3 TaxID=3391184 RepID=UPI0039856724
MKKLLTLLLLLLCGTITTAQEALLPVRIMGTPKATLERFVGTDAFGWQYVTAENEFRKTKDGRTLKYRNVALGDITFADLQNPLQVVLFYKKFNTVVLLDSQLNETAVINFNELPNPIIAEAVGLASQNRLWVYDVSTQQTGLFDLKKNTFRTITPPFNDGVLWYQSDYNYFYWIDNKGLLFSLNLFGNVKQLGSIPQFNSAQMIAPNVLLLATANALIQYNVQKSENKPVSIVEKTFGAFYFKDGILSIFTDNEIVQYKISLPQE